MKRVIEMEDNLQEIVESAEEDIINEFKEKEIIPEEYINIQDMIYKLDYDGTFHEIIDGSTPISQHEVEDLYYLYRNETDSAFEAAGIGDKSDYDNYKQVALFYLIKEKVIKSLEDWFNEL